MKLFSLNGRATRAQWWCINLCGFVVGIIVAVAIIYSIQSMLEDPSMAGGLLIFVGALFSLAAYLIVSFSVTVRRLHDRGRSGWFYLVYWVLNFIPVVNVISGVAYIIDLGFMDGVYGPNQYGEDPKGREPLVKPSTVNVCVCQNVNTASSSMRQGNRFCSKCGNRIAATEIFCQHCGAKIS